MALSIPRHRKPKPGCGLTRNNPIRSPRSSASDAPAPPDDPPLLKAGFQGFLVGGNSLPPLIPTAPISHMLVPAWMMPPASNIRSTGRALPPATLSRNAIDLALVGLPLTPLSSLTAMGNPSNAPTGSPF